MNADGWGLGLHTPDQAAPVRWRSAKPMWADASLASMAPVLRAGSVLAAVRSASVGMPADETAAAPFVDPTGSSWLLSHNGKVDRTVLPASHRAESVCDSAVLAAHVFEEGVDHVARTIARVAAAAPDAYLNLLMTDGRRVLGLTWGDPLSYLVEPDGVVVASEPYDDDPPVGRRPRSTSPRGGPRGAHRDRPLIPDTAGAPDMSSPDLGVHLDPGALARQMAADVRDGLTRTPKVLPPKYFYDGHGSDLFDQITRLPEYYPTRTEASILAARASDIAEASRARTLVELGSGTSEKTRLLLRAMRDTGTLEHFVPFDVDPVVLEEASLAVAAEFPGLDVAPAVGDFEKHLGELPRRPDTVVAFLGSTIGNLDPGQRADFLREVRGLLAPDDHLLLGIDLVKPVERLVAAYDDAQGVTASFNKNVLTVINRSLDADFDLDAFVHVAVWDGEHERIEMRLESRRDQQVRVGALDLEVGFAAGEQMRTEISSKFRRESIGAELGAAGLEVDHWWTDEAGDFAVLLARPGTR